MKTLFEMQFLGFIRILLIGRSFYDVFIYVSLLFVMKKNSEKKLAAKGFDPPTSELWAQHASTAPRCY